MSAATAMYPIAHNIKAGGSRDRSDITKILEYWRWCELGGKELKRLADLAETRALDYFGLQTDWGRMMCEVWTGRKNALLDAAREQGQN